ncbi:hypothetical protein [Candidatus Regiella endosymbiont of Tuberolachnus salignus]|uniref:hypothetical protein n=1 Tax=Candidatus Regiella endosymbiont of Tuberolachnus salignus TaxID=3077956 RepID=UPI0030D33723
MKERFSFVDESISEYKRFRQVLYPSSLKLPLDGQGDRPMSVDTLPDEANTRSQQHSGFKDEGYIPNEFRVTARRQGCETDERRHTT